MKKILINFLIIFLLLVIGPKKTWAAPFQCGEIFTLPMFDITDCNCAHYDYIDIIIGPSPAYMYCCGWYYNDLCNAVTPPSPTAIPTPTPMVPPVDEGTLDSFNPLKLFSTKANQLSTPGGIVSEILKFAFPLAGIILFVMLVMAGFKMLTGATTAKNTEEGKNMITTAILGFIILFAAYWIAQLIEIIFGINILNN